MVQYLHEQQQDYLHDNEECNLNRRQQITWEIQTITPMVVLEEY